MEDLRRVQIHMVELVLDVARKLSILMMGDYKLTEKGNYYMLRARFNEHDFTPNKKVPRGDIVRIYDAWLKSDPRIIKRFMIFKTWSNSFGLVSLRDKICIDNLFSFNDYNQIKFKKVSEFRS